MVGEHSTQTTLPSADLKPAWRAACLAYREVRRTGQLDHPAWLAARTAVRQVRPDLDEPTADQHAATAIAYASVFHGQWFWNGVGRPATRK
jgi:hypothetical protein